MPSAVSHFMKEHPEWFKDWEGEVPLEQIDDPIFKANTQLTLLNKRVQNLSQKLIGSEDKDQQPLIETE